MDTYEYTKLLSSCSSSCEPYNCPVSCSTWSIQTVQSGFLSQPSQWQIITNLTWANPEWFKIETWHWFVSYGNFARLGQMVVKLHGEESAINGATSTSLYRESIKWFVLASSNDIICTLGWVCPSVYLLNKQESVIQYNLPSLVLSWSFDTFFLFAHILICGFLFSDHSMDHLW